MINPRLLTRSILALMLSAGLFTTGCDDADNPSSDSDGQVGSDAGPPDGAVVPDAMPPDADLTPDADLRLRLKGQFVPQGDVQEGGTYRLKGEIRSGVEPGPSAGPNYQLAPAAPLSRQEN